MFAYDPLGRRISKEVYQKDYPEPRRRVLFHWQGLRLLQEVQSGLASLYVYATPDSYDPLARIDGRPGGEAIHYFHTNLAGLPEQLTDADGNAIWRSDYQGWGRTRNEWHGSRQPGEQNLRYQGQYYDREIEAHYNTTRFFDFDIGHFTQPDPIGLNGGLNLYSFAPNSNTWIDPLGLTPVTFTDSRGLSLEVQGYNSLSHLTDSQLNKILFLNGPNSKLYGLSPKDKHGNVIDSHHYKQRTEGPIIAMPQKHHIKNSKELHPHGNKKGHGISNRAEFNFWKREFWANQAFKELQKRIDAKSSSPTRCP